MPNFFVGTMLCQFTNLKKILYCIYFDDELNQDNFASTS